MNNNRANGHTWIQTIAGVIAILGFFGILVWTDLLPIGLFNIKTRTSTEEPTYPAPRPPNSISVDEVRQLNYGEVSIDEVNSCLSRAHSEPRPFVSFQSGDNIPQKAIVATDYSQGDKTWNELPVTPICHNGSWGLFESTSAYIAPHEGAYWHIVD